MKQLVPFDQGDLIDRQSRKKAQQGICLRPTWKWAACKAVDGKFKFSDANPEKSANKFLDDATPGILVRIWRGVTGSLTSAPIAKWSKSFTTANKTKHSVIPGTESGTRHIDDISTIPIDKPEGIVIGINPRRFTFGDGHAVAIYGGEKPRFFDPNYGEYQFNSLDEIRDFIKTEYPWAKSFNTISLSGKQDIERQRNEIQEIEKRRSLRTSEYKQINRLENKLRLIEIADRKEALSVDGSLSTFKKIGKIT